jgi:hypothetical protein
MGATKLGIQVSLDLNGFKGPLQSSWKQRRPISNQDCVLLIQSDLEDAGKQAIDAVLNAEGKYVLSTLGRT